MLVWSQCDCQGTSWNNNFWPHQSVCKSRTSPFKFDIAHDTGLCLPGFSGSKGSVSSGEPAPINAGCLGAESADGRPDRWLPIDVKGLLILIRVRDCYYIAMDYAHHLGSSYLYLSSSTCCWERQVESLSSLGTIHRFLLAPGSRTSW